MEPLFITLEIKNLEALLEQKATKLILNGFVTCLDGTYRHTFIPRYHRSEQLQRSYVDWSDTLTGQPQAINVRYWNLEQGRTFVEAQKENEVYATILDGELSPDVSKCQSNEDYPRDLTFIKDIFPLARDVTRTEKFPPAEDEGTKSLVKFWGSKTVALQELMNQGYTTFKT